MSTDIQRARPVCPQTTPVGVCTHLHACPHRPSWTLITLKLQARWTPLAGSSPPPPGEMYLVTLSFLSPTLSHFVFTENSGSLALRSILLTCVQQKPSGTHLWFLSWVKIFQRRIHHPCCDLQNRDILLTFRPCPRPIPYLISTATIHHFPQLH